MNHSKLCVYSRNENIYIDTTKLLSLLEKMGRIVWTCVEPKMARAVITEQTVEYPLLFQQLGPDIRKVLDFGCVEGLLPMQLCALGYYVTGLDFQPYPFSHPNFDFIQTDILGWEPTENEFDAVISVSTIEHVGLGAYGSLWHSSHAGW